MQRMSSPFIPRTSDKYDSVVLLDCMLYLTQYLYDPGILLSSANRCILENMYLRSNLSRKYDSVEQPDELCINCL